MAPVVAPPPPSMRPGGGYTTALAIVLIIGVVVAGYGATYGAPAAVIAPPSLVGNRETQVKASCAKTCPRREWGFCSWGIQYAP